MTTAPVFTQLRVGDLTVDHEVQRNMNTPHVARMQRDYDRHALGTWTISARTDGVLHVVDGQNRTELVKRIEGPDALVPCIVYYGLTREEEAGLFRKLNTFKGVHSLDKFRVRLVEREPVAVELSDMLAQYGWKVMAGGKSGSFSAVVELERIYNGPDARLHQPSPEAARRTIAIITTAWGHNVDGARSAIIGGLGRVIARHPEADDQKIARELALAGGPLALISAARARTAGKGLLYNSVAALVVERHNKGRRSNRLPAWEV